MISKEYKKETEVKVGKIFDNKEALVLAIRLKALDERYQFLSERSTPEKYLVKCFHLKESDWKIRATLWREGGGDLYVHALSTPVAYNRCGTLKGLIQGNKSGSCGHGWKQPDCANCFWHAAIALAAIQLDAYHKLIQVDLQRWSRAHCPLVRYNYMPSNSVESVNACTVLYRKLPVLKLADTYHAMV
ncbi:transposase, MuDR, MULE transposase domain protein [Tanacetum coccineum]